MVSLKVFSYTLSTLFGLRGKNTKLKETSITMTFKTTTFTGLLLYKEFISQWYIQLTWSYNSPTNQEKYRMFVYWIGKELLFDFLIW